MLNSLSPDQIDSAKLELSKIFKLAVAGVPIQMFSTAIDAVWHELLKDREGYKKFSIDACGHVVGHIEENGAGAVSFLEAYEKKFGQLPDVWFTDSEGKIDYALRRKYTAYGVIEANWDCGADHACESSPVKEPSPSKTANAAA